MEGNKYAGTQTEKNLQEAFSGESCIILKNSR